MRDPSRPPPTTPLPRRFITTSSKKHQPSGTPQFNQPPSAVRSSHHASTARNPFALPNTSQQSPVQFGSTPRFSFSNSRPTVQQQPVPVAEKSSAVGELFTRVVDRTGNIEETSQDTDEHNATPLAPNDGDVTVPPPNDDEMLLEPLQPPMKRPRLTDEENFPRLSPPTARVEEATPRRFLLSKPHGASAGQEMSSNTMTSPDRNRPFFVLPSTQSGGKSDSLHPLPEAFSPHRRGQKFVPGGMADTVRGWIVDITSSMALNNARGSTTATQQPSYKTRILVSSAKSAALGGDIGLEDDERAAAVARRSWLLIEGTYFGSQRDSEPAAAILGAPSSRKKQVDVKPGVVVGISAPCWHIHLEGKQWLVGVDWTVT